MKVLFDCFLEVVAPTTSNIGEEEKPAWILQTFPPDYKDKEEDKLKSVPQFVFPCKTDT